MISGSKNMLAEFLDKFDRMAYQGQKLRQVDSSEPLYEISDYEIYYHEDDNKLVFRSGCREKRVPLKAPLKCHCFADQYLFVVTGGKGFVTILHRIKFNPKNFAIRITEVNLEPQDLEDRLFYLTPPVKGEIFILENVKGKLLCNFKHCLKVNDKTPADDDVTDLDLCYNSETKTYYLDFQCHVDNELDLGEANFPPGQ